MMEEEYGYETTQTEIAGLNAAVTAYMATNDQAHVFREGYKLTLIRRSGLKWNEATLKTILGKAKWLKVTKTTLDTEKLDDLVRKGEVNRKEIERALTVTPQAPFVRRYDYKEGQSKDDAIQEEAAARAAMMNDAAANRPPKKPKRK